jgi:hypothetical protein
VSHCFTSTTSLMACIIWCTEAWLLQFPRQRTRLIKILQVSSSRSHQGHPRQRGEHRTWTCSSKMLPSRVLESGLIQSSKRDLRSYSCNASASWVQK